MNEHATPPVEPAPPPAPAAPTSDERTLALLAHLLGIFTWFVGALVIWLVKKDSSAYVEDQAKEALNFQIFITIAYAIAAVTTCLGIGLLLYPAAWVLNVIFCIIAAVAASSGQRYRYPLNARLIG